MVRSNHQSHWGRKYVWFQSSPRRISETEVLWDGFIIDLTEQHALKKELKEEKEKVIHTSKLATLGELAAGIGHEINNPLTILKSKIDNLERNFIQKNIINPDEFSKLQVAVKRIENIVSGLRIYSRKDNNLERETICLHVLIQQTLALMSEIIHFGRIDLSLDLAASHSLVYINEGQFQQVLMNFLTNARDATEGKESAKISLKTKNHEKSIIFSISDNGVEIEKKHQEKVFESFYTTKPAGKGTGMGLSISLELIQQMGGEISLFSNKGEGTTFNVTLPLLTSNQNKESPETSRSEMTTLNILVVDDEKDILAIFSDMLKTAGHQVSITDCPLEAQNIIKKNKFDYIFTDNNMPKLTGPGLIKSVKDHLSHQTKVILVTGGLDLIEESDSYLEIKDLFHEVVYKPFTKNKILKLLNNSFTQNS